MTIQQLYDIALEDGALNYEITLCSIPDESFKEEEFRFNNKRKTIEILL